MSASEPLSLTTVGPAIRRWLKRYAPVLWCLMGISVPISWLLWCLLGPRPSLSIAPQTTWLTGPVTEDGYVDYSAYILEQHGDSPVLPGKTAMATMCAQSGDSLNDSEVWCNDFRRLATQGMSPPNPGLVPHVYRLESDACKSMAWSFLFAEDEVPELANLLVALPVERPLPEIQAAIDTQFRYARLNQLQTFHRKPRYEWKSGADFDLFLRLRWREANTDWNEVLRLQNQLINRIRDDVCLAPSFREQRNLIQSISEDEGNNPSNDVVNRDFGRDLAGQAYHFVTSAIDLSVHYRFAHMARRLAEWKAMRGTYPEALEELNRHAGNESRIEKISTDPFSGEQFLYERRGAGFILYSVGHNLEDDFGHVHYGTLPPEYRSDAHRDIRTGRRPDDIVLKWPLK